MNAHTPGPWKVVAVTGEISVEDGEGRTIWGPVPRDSDENVEGDAHLIATAPAMLEALRKYVADADANPYGYEDGEWLALDAAREAIAQATGVKS